MKSKQNEAKDLIGDESEQEAIAQAVGRNLSKTASPAHPENKTPKSARAPALRVPTVGIIVLYYSNGNADGELIERPAIIQHARTGETSADLQIFSGGHTDFLRRTPQSEKPQAGYFCFRKQD